MLMEDIKKIVVVGDVHEPGSMIHSFGFGFGVANEEGVIIYANDNLDEFNRLVQKYKREENE